MKRCQLDVMGKWTMSSMMNQGGIGCRIIKGIREWRERGRACRELDEMPAADLGRLRDDLGISEGRVERVVRGSRAPGEMLPQMMVRYGLDPAGVAATRQAVMRDLQSTCAGCPFQRKCRRVLARGADQVECGRFCVNHTTLEVLARELALRG
jgi:uncharacterized protein YjiS (DUF1127 family)